MAMLLALPSPQLQSKLSTSPTSASLLVLVVLTARGAAPVVGVMMKAATGTVLTGTGSLQEARPRAAVRGEFTVESFGAD